MPKVDLRAAILAAQDIVTEDVPVPEWGVTVRVRALTGHERDQFEQAIVRREGKKTKFNLDDVRARMVALCVVDEEGNRVFADADVAELSTKSAAALDRVYDVASRLAGLSDEDAEELVKN